MSPPPWASGLNGDGGWAVGLTANERFKTSDSLSTFGLWGTIGIGDVYLETRALASDYRYIQSEGGANPTYPLFYTTIYVFQLGLLYAPAIRLSRVLKLSPHVGGGWCAVDIKTRIWLSSSQSGGESKDKSPGRYAHLGASLLFLQDRIRTGFDFQRVRGTQVMMFGTQETADHDQITFLVSYHWGGPR